MVTVYYVHHIYTGKHFIPLSPVTAVFLCQQFQENEKRRYEAEKKRAEQKHQRKLEELQAASEYTVKELEQLQNEKSKYPTSAQFCLWSYRINNSVFNLIPVMHQSELKQN